MTNLPRTIKISTLSDLIAVNTMIDKAAAKSTLKHRPTTQRLAKELKKQANRRYFEGV